MLMSSRRPSESGPALQGQASGRGPAPRNAPPATPLGLGQVPCSVFLLKDPFLFYHMVTLFFSLLGLLSCSDHRVFALVQGTEGSQESQTACLVQQKPHFSFGPVGHLRCR